MAASIAMNATYHDSDEFCASTAGWDIEFKQLDGGTLDAVLNIVTGPTVITQHVGFNRRFHQSGSAPDGVLTFGLPDTFDRMSWLGRRLEGEPLLNFNWRSGYDSVSDEDFTGCTFSIPSHSFQHALSSLDENFDVDNVHDLPDHFSTDGEQVTKVRSLAAGMCQCAQAQPANVAAYDELESDLIHLFARCVCGPGTQNMRTSIGRRQRALERALELITSTQDRITVSEV